MGIYEKLTKSIIDEIKKIIGPVAITQANQVEGLAVNHKIVLKGNPQSIIQHLIEKYKSIMGPVALTLAKRGAAPLLKKSKLKVPEELRR